MISLQFMITITVIVITAIIAIILIFMKRFIKTDRSSREIEELFNHITESLHEAFFVISNDWKKVYYMSPSYENIYGIKKEELYKSPVAWLSSVHPDDYERVKKTMIEFVKNNQFNGFPDYRICKADGSVRWISTRLFPVKISNGHIEKMAGIIEDITERRLAEDELKKNEESYRSIINNILDVFYRSDAKGNLIMTSPSVKKILGYDSKECIGMNIADDLYYHPADRDGFVALLSEKGEITDYETTLRRKDGSPVVVSTSSHFYYDQNGNIAGAEGVVRDITERKRVEDMFNKAFFENPCPMSISDIATGFYIEVNKALLDALEYEKSDVIGRTAPDLKIWRNPEERDRVIESIRTTGHAHNFDIEFTTKNGNIRNGIFFGEVIDVSGKKMLLSSVLNITGQREAEKLLKAANEELMASNEEFEAANEELIATNYDLVTMEEALRSSEYKYRTLIENLPAGIIAFNTDGVIIFANQIASKLLALKEVQMIGQTGAYPGWDVIQEDGTPLPAEMYPVQKTLSSGNPVKNIVLGIRRPEHTETIWLLCDTYPVMDNDGHILQIVTTFIDLTERKLAEEEVGKLKNYLTNIIDSNPDIFVGLDTEMKITLINRQTEVITGITMKNAIGMPLDNLLRDFAPSIEAMKAGIIEGKPVSLHGLLLEKNGDKRYYDLMLYPLITSGIEGAVVRIIDVTDLMKKEDQLRQAQKMEIVGNLAGGLAHDFNNVLSGIVGTTSLISHIIEKDETISERLRNYIDLIDKSGKRAAEMVQQLLALSRRSEVILVPLNLNIALKNVVQICQNTFDKSIEIYTEYSPAPAMINGDPSQVEQVLLNLCINASHAMTMMRDENDKQGGKLNLSIKKIAAEKYLCSIHPEAVIGNYWVVSHSDTGVGIASEYLHKIFDPFFTTKENERGTGLGLSMVYNIVHQLGGFLEVYSEPGSGSTFNIYFPELSGEGTSETYTDEYGIEKGEGLILVIDDEEIVRLMAESILLECGYKVILAASGREGINIYGNSNDEIRCVLLDMAMPGMSGKDVYIELKKINPCVKVLLASGFRQDERVQEAITLGINGFIQKPYSIIDLSKKIKEMTSPV